MISFCIFCAIETNILNVHQGFPVVLLLLELCLHKKEILV